MNMNNTFCLVIYSGGGTTDNRKVLDITYIIQYWLTFGQMLGIHSDAGGGKI